MIETKELSKRYGDIEALGGISFSIAAGTVLGLLGPNGAGKTTTMRLLTTFLPPSGGTAIVAGYDILKQPDEVRRHIGYLPETPPLYLEMRVVDYLFFVARIKGVERKHLATSVDEVISRCGLGDVSKRLCGQLSKGYRQRVGLAHALVHRPQVIILDEPTSGLDPAQIIEIRKLIAELAEDHTVILSTHILAEVAEVCSHVVIISAGKLVVSGTTEELTKEQTLEDRFLEAVAKQG